MAVHAPADKRFRRAHVRPSGGRRFRPADWRATLRVGLRAALRVGLPALVVALLVAYGLYRGAAYVLASRAFVVRTVVVTGNHHLSHGEVTALLDGIRGERMLTIDLEGWRRQVLTSPWVADAAIRRELPGTVTVAILEREPIGVARLGDDLFLVDRGGAIIDAHGPNYAEIDLPIVSGLEVRAGDPSHRFDPDRVALVVKVVDALATRRDLAARVSEIDVSDAHDAAVLLKDDTAAVRLGEDQFVSRLTSYLELAPTLHERVPDVDYVDVRFDQRVYVRPRAAAAAGGPRHAVAQMSTGGRDAHRPAPSARPSAQR